MWNLWRVRVSVRMWLGFHVCDHGIQIFGLDAAWDVCYNCTLYIFEEFIAPSILKDALALAYAQREEVFVGADGVSIKALTLCL